MRHLLLITEERFLMDGKVPSIFALLGVPVSFLFGEWTPFMAALLVLTCLDIMTGVMKGFYDKKLRSRKMSEGMMRKLSMWLVIIVANMIDVAMSDVNETMFGGVPMAKTLAIFFYIGMEGLSICENVGQMGVKLPKFLTTYLEVLRDKGDPQQPQVTQVDEIKVIQDNKEIKLETKE
jgi:toxin secretion/phage lysis holin